MLFAVGVRPRGRARRGARASRSEDGRIVTDERMRTSAPGIYAAGDVALARNAAAGRHLPVEHWGEALNQGEAAGANAAGGDAAWAAAPGFWSTIGTRSLKHVAWGDGFDEARLVVHEGGAFTVWYGAGGHRRRRARPRARRGLRARARADRAGAAAAVTILPAPTPGLRACVVVPARDEEALVGACVRALATQEGVEHDAYELLLVLDRCTDATEARARAAAAGLTLHVLHAAAPGVGAARRLGMDLACERLHAVGRPDGLIACTDADSEAAPDWLRRPARRRRGGRARDRRPRRALRRRAGGARPGDPRAPRARGRRPPGARARAGRAGRAHRALAVLGRLDGADRGELPAGRPARAAHRARGRGAGAAAAPPRRPDRPAARRPGHHLRPRSAAAPRAGSPWTCAAPAGSRTAATTPPPSAPRELAERKRRRSASCSPRARSRTRSAACSTRSRRSSVPGSSTRCWWWTPARATAPPASPPRRGARVADESELLREFGPALGKGDAMWRGVSATSGDIVAFLDTDTEDFHAGFALGLLGPLIEDAGARVRQGRLPAARCGSATPWCPTAAAASPSSSRARCSTSTSPTWPASCSRSRARSRRAASCSSGSRSRSATASRSRC